MNCSHVIVLLLHCLTILIDHNKNFIGLCHLIDQCLSEFLENSGVYLTMHERALKKIASSSKLHAWDIQIVVEAILVLCGEDTFFDFL